ncbi:hypothetical protein [Parapedobacter sp. DT-150]|uniref:hypothetical protein n=1 Tax=Parapedobacter sp. DT-150 TaxID=3396162 RepID=UPI003F1CD5D6
MRKIILAILTSFQIIILGACVGAKYKNNREFIFSIVFADCFHNDTVSTSINGVLLIDSVILNSDFSTGLTKTWISSISKTHDVVVTVNGVQKNVEMFVDKSLNLSISKNGQIFDFNLSLKNGKYIVVEGCGSKIEVNQFKNKLIFE